MTHIRTLGAILAVFLALPAQAQAQTQTVNFGDNSGRWANDGECDDRRFVGQGMAQALSWANTGHDAVDCQRHFDAGTIRLWDWNAARIATQCSAIEFGDDSGDYANDGECDDIRFEGLGMSSFLGPANIRKDAGDCRAYCEMGIVALRAYFE